MDVQELVRLVRDGVSDREIAALVGLNRRTVGRYRRWAVQQHLLDGPLPTLGELHEQLQATLPVHLPPQQTSSVAAYQTRSWPIDARAWNWRPFGRAWRSSTACP